MKSALRLSLFAIIAFTAGCAPSPRDVSCSNDGQCEAVGARYHYCLESRCVECLGSASCGEGRTCEDGACRCSDDSGCGKGEACRQGECKPR